MTDDHEKDYAFITALLGFLADGDDRDDLRWHRDRATGQLRFAILMSDVFDWGSADDEEVTVESLADLQRAYADCSAIDARTGPDYGGMLYAARRRGMRPQGAVYPRNRAFWPLFDACGPERPTEFNNPYRPGEGQGARHVSY